MATGTLTNTAIKDRYKSLLKITGTANDEFSGTIKLIEDGNGNDSVLGLATDSALISGNGTKLYFYDADGGEYISADSAAKLTIAGGAEVEVNTTIFDVNASGAVTMNGTTIDIDGSGAMTFNSSSGTIGIGNDAVAQAINIGSGAAARTITIGNVTGATQLVLNSGTAGIALASTGAGDITIDSDDTLLLDSDGILEINSSAGVISIGNDDIDQNINIGTQGERTINIATGSFADTINIGNATGATAVTIAAGTGDLALTSTDNLTLTATDIVSMTDGTATFSLAGTGATALSAATTVDLDCTGSMTLNSTGGTINIGIDNNDYAINIGTGGTRALNIGINDGTDLTTIAVKGPVTIDRNTAGASAEDGKGLYVDFDRTDPGSGTAAHNDIGIDLDVTSSSKGTSTVIGMDIDTVGAGTGTQVATGLTVDVSGGNTNYAALFNGGDVGIGTTTPADNLEIAEENGNAIVLISSYSNTAGTHSRFRFVRARDVDQDNPNAVADEDSIGSMEWLACAADDDDEGTIGARIVGSVETGGTGAIAANRVPTELQFHTAAGATDDDVAQKMVITADGDVGIGETSPDANLCIGQGGGDGKALTFKSSDIAHNFTSYSVGGVNMEADTYGVMLKGSATNGGLEIHGTSQGTYRALILQGNLDGTPDNTHTASGYGAIEIRGTVEDGNDAAIIGSTKNILSIGKGLSGVTVFIVDADGNYWFDGAAQSAFDSYDDAHLIRAFDVYNSPNDIIQTKFDDFLKYKKSALEDSGILYKMSPEEKAEGQKPFICGTRLQKLHNGAIWQQYTELEKMKELMYDAMVELLGKEKANKKLDSYDIKLLDKDLLN